MKKNFIILLLVSLMTFCSCERCNKPLEPAMTIENVIKLDKDVMVSKDKESFIWLETLVRLESYLDEENDGSYDEVVNVFQTINNGEPMVYKFQHFKDGTNTADSIIGFWIEDHPLLDSLLNVPYDSAFVLMSKANLPKPHSKNAILRNPIGPKLCNPQWVFGNIDTQIWVDATDGNISKSNPAFPE